MLFDKIQNPEELKLLKNLPDDYIEKLNLNIPNNLNKLVADFINLLLEKIHVPKDEIKQFTEKIYQRRYHDMFAWTENYNVQETRRIAKEEGKREGKEEGKREGKEEGKREGKEEGKREGKEEGKREGKEEGKKEGEKEAIMKVARNLLEMGMALKEIIQATGLSEEKLQELNAQ